MSLYDARRIEKPRHFAIAPLRNGRGKRSATVIGFDSEAEHGRPFVFQFSKAGDESATELCEVPARMLGGLDTFISYVHRTCTRKDTEYLIFGWNLQYEFTQLFGDLDKAVTCEGEFELDYRLEDGSGNQLARYTVHVYNDKRYSVTLENAATKRRVRLLDGMAFYVTGLDRAAKMLGVGAKLHVSEQCKRRFSRKYLRSKFFCAYARQDAYITRLVGEQIVSMHEDYDVPTCMSAPHFAARVFRRHFLNSRLADLPLDLEQAGLFSYHGGKNGKYWDGPHHFERMYSYDITSAYPEAMRQLPDIEQATWEWVSTYQPGIHALWLVSGRYHACPWRGAMTHGGQFIASSGYLEDTWITSYELDAMIDNGEISLDTCFGFAMRGEPGGSLVRYVDRFFDMKRTSEGARREVAKLFLNSLYGKFFQKVPLGQVGYYDLETGEVRYIESDPTQPFDYQAGGLYHPPIASLITGYVRGKIHRLEHKYDAVMTSTDGIFAHNPPDATDIGKDLGKLTVSTGSLDLWRERLYVFYGDEDCGTCNGSGATDGERCRKCDGTGRSCKYALHGFRGDLSALRQIPLARGRYSYAAQQMITNRLAARALRGRHYDAGTFASLEFDLDLTA